jgi:hypothetical protein
MAHNASIYDDTYINPYYDDLLEDLTASIDRGILEELNLLADMDALNITTPMFNLPPLPTIPPIPYMNDIFESMRAAGWTVVGSGSGVSVDHIKYWENMHDKEAGMKIDGYFRFSKPLSRMIFDPIPAESLKDIKLTEDLTSKVQLLSEVERAAYRTAAKKLIALMAKMLSGISKESTALKKFFASPLGVSIVASAAGTLLEKVIANDNLKLQRLSEEIRVEGMSLGIEGMVDSVFLRKRTKTRIEQTHPSTDESLVEDLQDEEDVLYKQEKETVC